MVAKLASHIFLSNCMEDEGYIGEGDGVGRGKPGDRATGSSASSVQSGSSGQNRMRSRFMLVRISWLSTSLNAERGEPNRRPIDWHFDSHTFLFGVSAALGYCGEGDGVGSGNPGDRAGTPPTKASSMQSGSSGQKRMRAGVTQAAEGAHWAVSSNLC